MLPDPTQPCLEALLAASPFFEKFGSGKLGILVAGAPIALVLDQVEELGLQKQLTVQTAGATHPAPRQVLESLLRTVDTVIANMPADRCGAAL